MTELDELIRPLRAHVEIAASPTEVWAVVADVRRTGEWSPECVWARPIGRVRAGGWLFGLNRRGRVRWATVSRVTEHEAPVRLAWTVLTNGSIWTYELEPVAVGTRVTESRQTPDGVSGFARWFTRRLLGGQQVHDEELEAGMREGLHRIKAIVE